MENYKDELKPLITLFKAHQSFVKLIKKEIKESGFDLNEFQVLEVIYHYQDISVKDINDKILIASSSLSYILNKLEKKDLIIRKLDPLDNRSFIISLTTNGLTIANQIFPKHYEDLKHIFKIFTKEEKNILKELLKRLGYEVEVYLNA